MNMQILVLKVKSAVRSPQSAVRSPQSAVRSPQSAVRSPQSAVRSPQSAVRSPQSAVRSPQSAVRSPQSAVRSPQSSIQATFHFINSYKMRKFSYSCKTPFLLTSFFLVVFLLSGFIGFSQTTAIPDANFERKLISLGYDSGTVNGEVLTANISGITSLDVSNDTNTPGDDKISDLTGIEAFTSLTSLFCSGNSLTSLNVFKNTALTFLSCSGNSLTSLNVSKNTALTFLSCWSNQLTSLDVSANMALTYLNCFDNSLTTLNVSKNTALTSLSCSFNQLTSLNVKNGNNDNFIDNLLGGTIANSFKATSNPNLMCIQVDNADYSTANWPNKDATARYSTDCSALPVTTNSVSSITSTSATLNGFIASNSGNTVTERGFVYSMSDTISLTTVNTSALKVTSSTGTDVFSKNITGLTASTTYYYKAYAISNNGTVYGITKSFNTTSTATTSIPDANFERKLIALGYDSGEIDGVVYTDNISSITSLDVSNDFNTPDNDKISDLTGIEAFTSLTSLSCHFNQLTSLDVSTNTGLFFLSCYSNQLTSLNVSSNTGLTSLYCYSNQLTSLNVTANTALTSLSCGSNQLTTLNVSANTTLTFLSCSGNSLASLDVSANTALTDLDCSNNSLTNLNVKNGNNNNFIRSFTDNRVANSFKVTGNLNLMCIQVDNAAYSTANWPNKDATARYSTDCSAPITAIPDANFERKLISLGHDSGTVNGEVLTANISGITSLDVSNDINTLDNDKISDLRGIEAFTSLTSLSCFGNSLTTLNVSANTALTYLYCFSNQLTSLDVSANTALTSLWCSFNLLTNLNVSANTALADLDCSSNLLTNLNVSANTALADLDCSYNSLISLNVKNGNNNNFIRSFGDNRVANSFKATSNPNLICIQVDNADYSTANWPNKDATARYSTDCSALSVTTNSVSSITSTSATLNGFIASNSGNTVTERGFVYSMSDTISLTTVNTSALKVTSSTGTDVFSKNITGLTASATYYYKAYAISNNGTVYGITKSFNTTSTATTSIPDANFERKLIALGYDSGEIDGVVYTDNISSITSLDVSNDFNTPDNDKISDLTGIEAFTSLTTLNSSLNQLTSLGVSANTALTSLSCSDNQLTSLDVSANTALTFLSCSGNSLTSLSVSKNTALTSLSCSDNSLTNLNVANGNNHNFIDNLLGFIDNLAITDNRVANSFKATGNPNLICIQVDNAGYSTANWPNKDATARYSTDCSAPILTTAIPDANFERKLISLGHDSGTVNGEVSTANISGITSLDVSNDFNTPDNDKISDLTGIEAFTSLTTLNSNFNQLTSLDVSSNTALTSLSCSDNRLTSLDVSANTALTFLSCSGNSLTSLNIANGNNDNFIDNLLGGTIANSFKATSNPNLMCIQVDNAGYSTANWPNKDATARYSTDCSAPITAIPDANFERKLISLGYDSGEIDGVVLTANISGITSLDVSNDTNTPGDDKISDLTGIEAFTSLTTLNSNFNQLTSLDFSSNTALTSLSCSDNRLTSLDIPTNTALTFLSCSGNSLTSLDIPTNTALTFLSCWKNQLTSLDVSKNTALTYLNCFDNSLTTLNVSKNTALTSLSCSFNQLTSLNVKNGNNNNFIRSFGDNRVANSFKATSNPNLMCIQVDNAGYSTANWPNKDATARYSTDCSAPITAIPDANFERKLISLGHDSGEIDGVVLTANISGITSLDVSNDTNTPSDDKISDLTGIEAFTSLTTLNSNFNQLTSLDVSANTALTSLSCSDNKLTSLDIPTNTALTFLSCSGNSLTSLDIPTNTALTFLSCWKNQLTSLDVSKNTALTYLNCFDNSLTTLNVSKNTALTSLSCSFNQLTSLNVKNGNNNNFIRSFGDNRVANSFKATGNPNLMCIQVDNAGYSTANWTNKDATAVYSANCDDTDNDGIFDNIDTCPNTPTGEDVNENGCSESQIDTDNDGIFDNIDTCTNTPTGESVNGNGCSESQIDTDNDGIFNNVDQCTNTPTGEDVNGNGCSESQIDTDNDGIFDNVDQCPNTPTGEAVNENGCSESQIDTDNDGIFNNIDTCPNTPTGEDVNENGCSESQIDTDNDGIFNNVDQCPNTPTGEDVNGNGCSESQIDTDNDGIFNNIDTCPDTPTGEAVNENGCSESQIDTDNDGIFDNVDQCPNTPTGEAVNENGCSESQIDTDNDGIFNNIDTCPNTPTGEAVNENGCSESQVDTDNDGIFNNIDTCPDTPTGEAVNENGMF